jgi:transposase
MGRVNTPILNQESKEQLEEGLKTGKKHAYRMRCQLILLKSEGRTSQEVASILKINKMSVNNWTNRYNRQGITGLETKAGRGRKPIIDKIQDETKILESIQSNRQRLQTAKAEWESASGKSVSSSTFRRFLKVLAEDINV